jgi:hypothetical protein
MDRNIYRKWISGLEVAIPASDTENPKLSKFLSKNHSTFVDISSNDLKK